jgi:hypothetical protein
MEKDETAVVDYIRYTVLHLLPLMQLLRFSFAHYTKSSNISRLALGRYQLGTPALKACVNITNFT